MDMVERAKEILQDPGIEAEPVGMNALIKTFPSLVMELSQQLRVAGRLSLADQIDQAAIARVTFDDTADAGYIHVQPSRELNFVETNVVGVRHGESIEVATRYWTNIDTDNFGRIVGIEILAPGDIMDELKEHASRNP